MAKVHDEGYGHQGSNYIYAEDEKKLGLPHAVKQRVHVPGSHSVGNEGEKQYETGHGEHHDGYGHRVDGGLQDEELDFEHEHMHPHFKTHPPAHIEYLHREAGGEITDADMEKGYCVLGSHNLKGELAEIDGEHIGGAYEGNARRGGGKEHGSDFGNTGG